MFEQIAIGLFGVTAVFLSQSHELRIRKYACLFGMASQPFWFYATWKAEQWGIFILCVMYAVCWAIGIYRFWIKG
jgi:hypothetical protein